MDSEFIPGLQLSEAYYWEAVRPILDAHFPGLSHSAALIGYSSDVIGYDTPVSRDHMWGPRLYLFLKPEVVKSVGPAIDEALRQNLPVRFHGYSTNFSKPDPGDMGVRLAVDIDQGPVDHMIWITDTTTFWKNTLGVDPYQELDPADWLTFPGHNLLSLVAGKVYYDGLGLEEIRQRFAYYPHDVWLYLMAVQWLLISELEAFVGRTYSVGDEIGSRVITARLVDRVMYLCFLMEKRYPPYAKWFGTAFKELNCYPHLGPLLEGALDGKVYRDRESCLAQAYTFLAEMHNNLGITPALETRVRTYAGWHLLRSGIEIANDDPNQTRPYLCIFGGRFFEAIMAAIQDPKVLALSVDFGSVNQFLVESSGAIENIRFCRNIKDLIFQ